MIEPSELQLLLANIETLRRDFCSNLDKMEARLAAQIERIHPMCQEHSKRIDALEVDQAIRQTKARTAGAVIGFLGAVGGGLVTVIGRHLFGG